MGSFGAFVLLWPGSVKQMIGWVRCGQKLVVVCSLGPCAAPREPGSRETARWARPRKAFCTHSTRPSYQSKHPNNRMMYPASQAVLDPPNQSPYVYCLDHPAGCSWPSVIEHDRSCYIYVHGKMAIIHKSNSICLSFGFICLLMFVFLWKALILSE